MTDDELAAIEARANAAKAGPWEVANCFDAEKCWCGGVNPDVVAPGQMLRRNAIFIAHARQDVPRLVAEVRRLRSCPECKPCGGCE